MARALNEECPAYVGFFFRLCISGNISTCLVGGMPSFFFTGMPG